jgi:hypothetical protein
MIGIGRDAQLIGEKRNRGDLEGVQANCQQRCGDLLAGRDQHVGLAGTGSLAQFRCQLEETIGLTRHRGHHHDHSIAEQACARNALGDRSDAFGGANRSAAVLLNNQAHGEESVICPKTPG